MADVVGVVSGYSSDETPKVSKMYRSLAISSSDESELFKFNKTVVPDERPCGGSEESHNIENEGACAMNSTIGRQTHFDQTLYLFKCKGYSNKEDSCGPDKNVLYRSLVTEHKAQHPTPSQNVNAKVLHKMTKVDHKREMLDIPPIGPNLRKKRRILDPRVASKRTFNDLKTTCLNVEDKQQESIDGSDNKYTTNFANEEKDDDDFISHASNFRSVEPHFHQLQCGICFKRKGRKLYCNSCSISVHHKCLPSLGFEVLPYRCDFCKNGSSFCTICTVALDEGSPGKVRSLHGVRCRRCHTAFHLECLKSDSERGRVSMNPYYCLMCLELPAECKPMTLGSSSISIIDKREDKVSTLPLEPNPINHLGPEPLLPVSIETELVSTDCPSVALDPALRDIYPPSASVIDDSAPYNMDANSSNCAHLTNSKDLKVSSLPIGLASQSVNLQFSRDMPSATLNDQLGSNASSKSPSALQVSDTRLDTAITVSPTIPNGESLKATSQATIKPSFRKAEGIAGNLDTKIKRPSMIPSKVNTIGSRISDRSTTIASRALHKPANPFSARTPIISRSGRTFLQRTTFNSSDEPSKSERKTFRDLEKSDNCSLDGKANESKKKHVTSSLLNPKDDRFKPSRFKCQFPACTFYHSEFSSYFSHLISSHPIPDTSLMLLTRNDQPVSKKPGTPYNHKTTSLSRSIMNVAAHERDSVQVTDPSQSSSSVLLMYRQYIKLLLEDRKRLESNIALYQKLLSNNEALLAARIEDEGEATLGAFLSSKHKGTTVHQKDVFEYSSSSLIADNG